MNPWLVALAACVVVAAGCTSGSDDASSTGSTARSTVSTTTSPPTTSTTTTLPPTPSSEVPFDPDGLQVSGESSSGATIEVTFGDGRAPITTQAAADGSFSFSVGDLGAGTTTMTVVAHPAGQSGAVTGLDANFTIRRAGSETSSSVTCNGAIDVTVNVDDAPDLTVVC